MQNKLDKFDAIKLEEARNVIAEVYDYNFKSLNREKILCQES